MRIVNYHTHTCFCDGENTPEELVLHAIDLGMGELGFSGHSYVKAQGFGMDDAALAAYKSEISHLKEKYKEKIKIYLGIEYDYFSKLDTSELDFVIGSVHLLMKDGRCLETDISEAQFRADVNKYFGGDYIKYAEEYYSLVGDIYNKTHCDIIGHFDLVTKFNEGDRLFDTNDERYKAAYNAALESLKCSPAVFEINTGAISRGYRSEPYPSRQIIKNAALFGAVFTVSSDCHSVRNLDFQIENNIRTLRSQGYKCFTSMEEILRYTRSRN